MKKGALEMQEL
jgi:hypothetical protein